MHEMTGQAWKSRGSSVVYDRELLRALIGAVGSSGLVSLREALGWAVQGGWPASPPIGKDGKPVTTIVIGGMETILDVTPKAEAEQFVRQRLRHLIQTVQSKWDQCGIVFGFTAHERRFEVTMQEEVLFVTQGGDKIRLSSTLWNGAAADDLWAIIKRPAQGSPVRGGFHVTRVS